MLPKCLTGSTNLVRMHQEPAVAIEVHPAANDAHHARAASRFLGFVCIPVLNAINLLSQILAIMF